MMRPATCVGGFLHSFQERVISRVESHREGTVDDVPIHMRSKVCDKAGPTSSGMDSLPYCGTTADACMTGYVMAHAPRFQVLWSS